MKRKFAFAALGLLALLGVGYSMLPAMATGIGCNSIASPIAGLQFVTDIAGTNCWPERGTVDTGALITDTAANGGVSVASTDQTSYNAKAITCVFAQSAHAGTPSIAMNIQGKDAASGLYYTLIQSAVTATVDAGTVVVSVGLGLPNSANVSAGLPIPATWRVDRYITGSSETVTGTIGCSETNG